MKRLLFLLPLRSCCTALALLWTLGLAGQVTILPQFTGGTLIHIDQMYQVLLLNNSPQPQSGQLTLALKTSTGAEVLTATSFLTTLPSGSPLRGRSLSWNNGFRYASNDFARAIQATGKLPFGEFVLCYYFNASNGTELGSYCSEFQVKIGGLPALTYPADQSRIITPNPVLQWRPPLSLSGTAVEYDLLLVAMEEGQSAVEAIARNTPLVIRKRLTSNQLTYPLGAPQLTEGVHYAWQVTAHFGTTEIGATDIWTFTLGPPNIPAKVASNNDNLTYPLTSDRILGAWYLAEERVCFAFQNRQGMRRLSYRIYPASNPQAALESIPEIPLVPGWNKISIAGEDLKELVADEMYILEIENSMQHKQYLKFKYQTVQP